MTCFRLPVEERILPGDGVALPKAYPQTASTSNLPTNTNANYPTLPKTRCLRDPTHTYAFASHDPHSAGKESSVIDGSLLIS